MSFIRVHFGDNEELVCNPNCSIKNLLDNIKQRCSSCCQLTDTIDLCDRRGNLQNLAVLSNYDLQTYASNHLSDGDRGEYLLLKIQHDETGRVQHVPLLEKACLTYPIILDSLEIPTWVEGASQRSSTRKLNRLRLATKLAMAVAHDKKHKPPSGKLKSVSRSTSGGDTTTKMDRRPPSSNTREKVRKVSKKQGKLSGD